MPALVHILVIIGLLFQPVAWPGQAACATGPDVPAVAAAPCEPAGCCCCVESGPDVILGGCGCLAPLGTMPAAPTRPNPIPSAHEFFAMVGAPRSFLVIAPSHPRARPEMAPGVVSNASIRSLLCVWVK